MTDGRRRGDGRAALLAAGAALAGSGSLTDYVGFVPVEAVARRAGVSSGLLYHHFPTRATGRHGGAAAFVVAAVAESLADIPISERTVEALGQATAHFAAGEANEALALISAAGAADVVEHARGSGAAAFSVNLIASAATPQDPVAVRLLRAHYDQILAVHVAGYEVLLAAWGREVRDPFTTETMAIAITALAEGWAVRMRFDERATPELFSEAVKGLVAVVTGPTADPDPRSVDELLGGRFTVGDPARTAAAARAAVELYERGGWPRVTMPSVAALAGVDRRTVKARFGSRDALAGPIWARFAPRIGDRLAADCAEGRSLGDIVARHLCRVAELVATHKAMAVAWSAAAAAAAVSTDGTGSRIDEPSDPRWWLASPSPFSLALAERAEQFRPALAVGTTVGAATLAAFLTDSLVDLVLTRPESSPHELSEYVCAVCLSGAVVA